MNKKMIILVIVMVILSAGIGFSLKKNVQGAELSDSDTQLESLITDKSFKTLNIDFKKTQQAVKIDKETAINKAKGFLGPKPNDSVKISACKVIFTNKSVKGKIIGTNIVPDNLPVWLVTFKGVSVNPPSAGPMLQHAKIKPYTELNVIIDADTGEWGETFAFRWILVQDSCYG